MNPVLARNIYLVKEHVGMFKAANNFDVLDPATGTPLLLCREPNLGAFTKLLRFTDWKRYTPFDIQIQLPDGRPIITIKRGVSLFLSLIHI